MEKTIQTILNEERVALESFIQKKRKTEERVKLYCIEDAHAQFAERIADLENLVKEQLSYLSKKFGIVNEGYLAYYNEVSECPYEVGADEAIWWQEGREIANEEACSQESSID